MFNVNFAKRLSQVLVFIALLFTISDFVWAEVKYNPYPIIFVHGYNVPPERRSRDDLWRYTRYNFKQFFEHSANYPFINPKEFKYWNEDWGNYMSVFDYRAQSNGDLDKVADKLGDYIDEILFKLPKDQEQKVIIVAHSAGGIVTRRLLAKNSSYQNKIERVVFIGTPHLGSPLASGVILTDRMRPELEKIYEEHHKWTGIDRNLDLNWQFLVYSDRDKQITDALNLFNTVVNWDVKVSIQEMLAGDKNNLNPYGPPDENSPGRYNPTVPHHQGQGVAVGQLVVPQTVKTTKTFVASAFSTSAGVVVKTEPLIASSFYDKTDTFLYNNTFARPNNFKIIQGTGSLGSWIMGKSGGALFKSLASYEGLPAGNTFDDLDNGDGIVTPLSQTAIGAKADYQIPNSHITEVNAWQPILQAIDDKPVIESVRVIPEDWNAITLNWWNSSQWYYLIFKVRDYLLADIEIESLTLDGEDIVPSSFNIGGVKKPYNSLGKRFLEERDCDKEGVEFAKYKDILGNEKSLHLMPGEFFIRTQISTNAQALYIKIKNPAAQYNTDTPNKFITEKTLYFYTPKVNAFWTSNIDVPPYWPPPIYNPEPGPYPPEPWPHSSSLYFNIQDSPTQDARLNVWLYNVDFKDIPRKFATAYTAIPWTSSRNETLPDGQTTITLHSGGFDINHLFATWYGENDSGGTVPPHINYEGAIRYNLKVTLEPSDANSNDNTIFLLGSGMQTIAADPSFIQPSRREGVTW